MLLLLSLTAHVLEENESGEGLIGAAGLKGAAVHIKVHLTTRRLVTGAGVRQRAAVCVYHVDELSIVGIEAHAHVLLVERRSGRIETRDAIERPRGSIRSIRAFIIIFVCI